MRTEGKNGKSIGETIGFDDLRADDGYERTEYEEMNRYRVPGGWLYRTTKVVMTVEHQPVCCSEALAFVPDEDA